uniref:Uncharacterized protein n=1 Tax=Sipha flava TaxID=143950 RepID=A0A2S2Q4B9_9HEMI
MCRSAAAVVLVAPDANSVTTAGGAHGNRFGCGDIGNALRIIAEAFVGVGRRHRRGCASADTVPATVDRCVCLRPCDRVPVIDEQFSNVFATADKAGSLNRNSFHRRTS